MFLLYLLVVINSNLECGTRKKKILASSIAFSEKYGLICQGILHSMSDGSFLFLRKPLCKNYFSINK